jgi:hypothetical protein
MKSVNIISERNFEDLVPDVNEDARSALWELWRDDLSSTMDQKTLIMYANGLLKYFGSDVIVTDVGWSDAGACFEWEVLQDQ